MLVCTFIWLLLNGVDWNALKCYFKKQAEAK